jgi:hypothetical protein
VRLKRQKLLKILKEETILFEALSDSADHITSLYLFDFDDTLANTENLVHVTYVDALTGNETGKDSLPSGEFEEYRQKSEEERASDLLDFSDFDNVKNAVPIDNVLKIMSHALTDPSSFTAIITARPNTATADIFDFLKKHNVKISPEHINTVGDAGGKPADKLAIARKYVQRFLPKEVHFFDDSQKNNDAIISLCDEIDNEIEVFTYDIISGSPVPVDTCGSYSSKRMMEIAGII